MELNNINNKGAWSEIAAALNQNFLKILAELLKYQHVTTISGANFLGYFTSSSVLPNPAEAAWAVAGNLKAVTVYAYYTSDAVPNGFSAGWNALSSLGTYDFTDYSNILYKTTQTNEIVNKLEQDYKETHRNVEEEGFHIIDKNGHVVVSYGPNGLDFASISRHALKIITDNIGTIGLTNVYEEGFYVVDSNGYIGVSINQTGLHSINMLEF